ncbi:MAG TPA: class I SAM-dependent methyltransferase [Elusimicrobiota bacterium]|nr:class I SAM-dependent methyltransferase [Elusimicrobiota bacterium]
MKSKFADTVATSMENRRRLSLMRRFLEKGSKVLEMGCGTGEFARYASTTYEMWGIDISPYAILEAQGAMPAIKNHFMAGRHEDLSLKNESFDALVLWDCLEHLWHSATNMERLSRLVKKDGMIFISTPLNDSLTATWMGKYWHFMIPPIHVELYTKGNLFFLAENRLKSVVKYWGAFGKWTSSGFFFHKLLKMIRLHSSQSKIDIFGPSAIGRIPLYIPTGDIQYMAAVKS